MRYRSTDQSDSLSSQLFRFISENFIGLVKKGKNKSFKLTPTVRYIESNTLTEDFSITDIEDVAKCLENIGSRDCTIIKFNMERESLSNNRVVRSNLVICLLHLHPFDTKRNLLKSVGAYVAERGVLSSIDESLGLILKNCLDGYPRVAIIYTSVQTDNVGLVEQLSDLYFYSKSFKSCLGGDISKNIKTMLYELDVISRKKMHLVDELDAAEIEAEKSRLQLEKVTAQRMLLQEESKHAIPRIEEIHQENRELSQKLKNEECRANTLRLGLAGLNQKIEQLYNTDEIDAAKRNVDRLRQSNSFLDSKNESLVKEINDIYKKIDEIKISINDINEMENNLQEENSNLESSVMSINKEMIERSKSKTPQRLFNSPFPMTPGSDFSLFEIEQNYKMLDKEHKLCQLRSQKDSLDKTMMQRGTQLAQLKLKLSSLNIILSPEELQYSFRGEQDDQFSDIESETMSMASFSQSTTMDRFLKKRGIEEIADDNLFPYTGLKALKIDPSDKSQMLKEITFFQNKIITLKKNLEEKQQHDEYYHRRGGELVLMRRRIDDDLIDPAQTLISGLTN